MAVNNLLLLACMILLAFVPIVYVQNIETNQIDDTLDNDIHVETYTNNNKEDANPFAEAAAAFMNGDHGAGGVDINNVISNFIQADGGKTIGNMLMGAAQQNGGDGVGQILSGIGSMLNNNNAGAALDPSIIGNLITLMANPGDPASRKGNQPDLTGNIMSMFGNLLADQKGGPDKFDLGSIVGLLGNLMQNNGENPLYLVSSLVESFLGPDARRREDEHASHAYLLPPLLEKAHLYFDHFKHTELYKALWRVTGGEKFFNMFAVDGKFSFTKFFEQLENRSFRRHWLKVVTRKITDLIALVTDAKRHKKFMHTGVSLLNGFLKSVEFPKSTLFDITRPTETLTNLFNYFFKKYLNMEVESRQYVKPAVLYVEEVINLALKKGILFKDGINSAELSTKLTDTINLEIIEPVARVWRAYRFAKKVPECDKYVMCLINQEDPHEVLSLPGLKPSLSKTASMFVSWFLSQQTGTSFWTLYSAINDEKDCSVRFMEQCNDFHIDEVRVHEEYEHTEL